MTSIHTKVEFTNLERVLYPALKITKAKVIEYFIKVAPRMLGLLKNRPLVLTRFPNGINKPGFYEKNAPMGTPSWVKTFTKYSETAKREIDYIVCDEIDTLMWLANLAALEIHMTLSQVTSFSNPDLILFDMDPQPPAGLKEAADVSLLLKEKLDEIGLVSYVKTTGKRGLHVIVPFEGNSTFAQTRSFVHRISTHMARESELIVSEFSRVKKPGTVYIDYLQNSNGKTMICPYSLRAISQATVSAPLYWKDVKKGLKAEDFNISSVIEVKSDPWKGLLSNKQKLEVN